MGLKDEVVLASDPPEDEPTEETAEDEDDEETKDPQQIKKKECWDSAECAGVKEILDKCTARVSSASEESEETCEEEMIDFVHCVDHCASKGLFSKLI